MSGPKLVGGLGTATPLEAALVKAGAPAGGGCRDPGAGPPKADGPYICPYMPLHCQGEGKQGAKPGGPAGPPKKSVPLQMTAGLEQQAMKTSNSSRCRKPEAKAGPRTSVAAEAS